MLNQIFFTTIWKWKTESKAIDLNACIRWKNLTDRSSAQAKQLTLRNV